MTNPAVGDHRGVFLLAAEAQVEGKRDCLTYIYIKMIMRKASEQTGRKNTNFEGVMK
jgi:hypothetical protein